MTLPPHRAIFLTGPHAGASPRVAVKDCIDIVGETTAAGSRALAQRPAAVRDAAVVERLRSAGCTIAGRVSMHELAFGVTGVNAWSGTPLNPYYPRLVPGGSSSGSAAVVAAGLVDFSIGTDTGGSIRVPAACCGVVGLKPSFGRVSRSGVTPAISSLDCVGPLAASVAAVEAAMAMLVGDWSRKETPTRPSIGLVADVDRADQIAPVLEMAFPDACVTPVAMPGLAAAQEAGLRIIGRETSRAFAPLLTSGLIGNDVRERLYAGGQIDDDALVRAEDVRRAFTAEVDALLADHDAIALPTLPCPPPTLAEAADPAAAIPITAFCRPFNLSGHPAIALPVGEIADRPLSLQLVGRRGADEALCAIARAIPTFIKGKTA